MINETLIALPWMLLAGSIAWLYAASRKNVNIVDSLWSLFFLLAALIYLYRSGQYTLTTLLLVDMVALWALRLSVHLSIRNANKPEDRRYAAMRANNPRFNSQSLLTVFGLQALIAWLIAMPLAAVLFAPVAFNNLHILSLLLFITGFTLESVADWQLVQFKSDPASKGKVLDSGLWRYSRHPNYFGEALVWWSFFVYALAGGALWTIFSPILMTFLLLKVSGVTLLEKDMHERRPAYREYIERTPAFFPWWPKAITAQKTVEGS